MSGNSFKHLLVRVEAGVCNVSMNHPERLNAIDHGPGSMQDELVQAVTAAGADDAVRCIVIRGEGRAFSSGGYLPPSSGNAKDAAGYYKFLSMEDAANEAMRASPKPIFAAVHGVCYGAALIMALHFDFIVASENARFGFIETRFGSTGVEMLAHHVSPQWSKFLALSGELISARRAASIGLILRAIPEEQFETMVADLALRIAAMPTPAAIHNRQLLNAAAEGMGWGHQKHVARALNAVTNSTEALAPDGRSFHKIRGEEGIAAFKEMRDRPFIKPWFEDEG